MIGREEEFERASRVAERALAGSGGLLVTVGEPEIGKSRLVKHPCPCCGYQTLESRRRRGRFRPARCVGGAMTTFNSRIRPTKAERTGSASDRPARTLGGTVSVTSAFGDTPTCHGRTSNPGSVRTTTRSAKPGRVSPVALARHLVALRSGGLPSKQGAVSSPQAKTRTSLAARWSCASAQGCRFGGPYLLTSRTKDRDHRLKQTVPLSRTRSRARSTRRPHSGAPSATFRR
jgi:hypothetical protein